MVMAFGAFVWIAVEGLKTSITASGLANGMRYSILFIFGPKGWQNLLRTLMQANPITKKTIE